MDSDVFKFDLCQGRIMFPRIACFVVGAVLLITPNVLGDNVYHDILQDILVDYEKRVSPVKTSVSFSFDLRHISEFDVNKGLLVLDAWIEMFWNDDRLTWAKEDFENETQVIVPSSEIWIPDITLYNSATGFTHYDDEIRVVVSDNGSISYIPHVQFKSYCDAGSDYDGTQDIICTLKFGSWVYNANQVDMQLHNTGYSNEAFDNDHLAGWTFKGISATRNVVLYDCCPDPYVDITYSITLHADADINNDASHANADAEADANADSIAGSDASVADADVNADVNVDAAGVDPIVN